MRTVNPSMITLLLSFLSLFLITPFYCEGAERPGASQAQAAGAANEHEAKKLERRTRKALGSFQEKICAEVDMVSYHGKCMPVEEKTFLFEMEVRHVERLLNEAIRSYQIASLEEVAFAFNHAERFVDKFESDEAVDERIAKKMILLLGYIYRPADKWNGEMREALQKSAAPENPIAFLRQQRRREDFSKQVYVPLMKLLAEQIADYESRYGEEDLKRFMRDNGLGDILDTLENASGTK